MSQGAGNAIRTDPDERGVKTAPGKAWTAVRVIRVRERLAEAGQR